MFTTVPVYGCSTQRERECTARGATHTEGDVADVVSHCGVRVLQLERRLSVAEQHLRSCVTRAPALLKLLQGKGSAQVYQRHYICALARHTRHAREETRKVVHLI